MARIAEEASGVGLVEDVEPIDGFAGAVAQV